MKERALLDTKEVEPFGALVRRLYPTMATGMFQVVVCGPPGSGKMTAVEVAAQACGLAVAPLDIESATLASFEAVLRQCGDNVVTREYLVKPMVLVVRGLEVLDPKYHAAALKAASKQRRFVVLTNRVLRDHVQHPLQLMYHKGFTQAAMKAALNGVPGYHWLPRAIKEHMLYVDGMQAGDLRRALLAVELEVKARGVGENIDAAIDTAPHQFFNCQRFMNVQKGHGLAPHHLEAAQDWIETNLSSCLDLEDAADCASDLVHLQLYPAPDARGETLDVLGARYARDGSNFEVMRPRKRGEEQPRRRKPHEFMAEQLRELRAKSPQAAILKSDPAGKIEAERHQSLMHALNGNGAADGQGEAQAAPKTVVVWSENVEGFLKFATGRHSSSLPSEMCQKVAAFVEKCEKDHRDESYMQWLGLLRDPTLFTELRNLTAAPANNSLDADDLDEHDKQPGAAAGPSGQEHGVPEPDAGHGDGQASASSGSGDGQVPAPDGLSSGVGHTPKQARKRKLNGLQQSGVKQRKAKQSAEQGTSAAAETPRGLEGRR